MSEGQAVAKTARGLADILAAKKEDIQATCSQTVTAERLIKLAMLAYNRSPELRKCSPESIYVALLYCAELGLEPNPLGHAYLVPFGNECVFIPGYRGLVKLALRSGQIATLDADVVHEKDEFHWEKVDGIPHFKHKPYLGKDDPGEVIAAYAAATMRDGRVQMRVLSRRDIDKVRESSRAKNSGPWKDWFEEMAIKTAIRRASKLWPMSREMERAEELEAENDMRRDILTRGDWKPPAAARTGLIPVGFSGADVVDVPSAAGDVAPPEDAELEEKLDRRRAAERSEPATVAAASNGAADGPAPVDSEAEAYAALDEDDRVDVWRRRFDDVTGPAALQRVDALIHKYEPAGSDVIKRTRALYAAAKKRLGGK